MSGSSRVVLDPLVEGYLDYLRDIGRKAGGTVKDIRCTLRRLSEDMAVYRPGAVLWELELSDYLYWLEEQRRIGMSGNTLSKNISHLRGFLEYALRGGHSERNVMDGFSLQEGAREALPRVISEAEALKMVGMCPDQTSEQRRDRMVILLLYGCGLRTKELCGLCIEDVDLQRREVLVRGKGDRDRMVPIPAGVFVELQSYMLEQKRCRGALLRTLLRRHRLDVKEVNRIVRLAASRAGLAHWVTAKALRHSYATHLMDRGVDISIISSLMGHRSPRETGVYLHVLGDKPRSAVGRLGANKGQGGHDR
jgi:site-specific recombinase XerD